MKWKKLDFRELERRVKENTLGLQQKEIAARLGISKNTLVYSIRKRVLKLTVFQDLCEILQISPCVFFTPDYNLSEEDRLIAADQASGYDTVPREMYEEMKEQLKSEISNLMEINSGLIGHKRQTGT